MPAKIDVRTEFVLDQQIAIAKALPIPIPLPITVLDVLLSSANNKVEFAIIKIRSTNVLFNVFMSELYLIKIAHKAERPKLITAIDSATTLKL